MMKKLIFVCVMIVLIFYLVMSILPWYSQGIQENTEDLAPVPKEMVRFVADPTDHIWKVYLVIIGFVAYLFYRQNKHP